MTGYLNYNLEAFEEFTATWEEMGFEVHTPFEANSAVWMKHYSRPFNPRVDRCDYGNPLLKEMFAADIALMLKQDCVALLPGWRKSRGASAEADIARLNGMELFDAIDGRAISGETILEEAQRLVHGDRGSTYGHPIVDYGRTGRMWGAILGIPDIDPRICCLMMAAVKISRETQGHKRDNLTDLAGYAECASMVAERQAEDAKTTVVWESDDGKITLEQGAAA
jgi:hypothetical protein